MQDEDLLPEAVQQWINDDSRPMDFNVDVKITGELIQIIVNLSIRISTKFSENAFIFNKGKKGKLQTQIMHELGPFFTYIVIGCIYANSDGKIASWLSKNLLSHVTLLKLAGGKSFFDARLEEYCSKFTLSNEGSVNDMTELLVRKISSFDRKLLNNRTQYFNFLKSSPKTLANLISELLDKYELNDNS